ncbi:DUF1353 domain-containing protein [Nocardioides currus]|nr:DUF1353 domain-containing protein [Nocardioides currus]
MIGTRVPWASCFEDPDRPGEPATILLRQVGRKSFLLESSMTYTGDTGVADLPDRARTLRPSDLGDPPLTDLASVPAALRWFVSSYDVHTPAALLHDRLIGPTNDLGVEDAVADRFFRFMLKGLGVRFVRRWMMWTAVAFGTRWRSPRLRGLLLLWSVAAAVGMSTFVIALCTQEWLLVGVAAAAPLPSSLLWGRQYGAGLTAAATAIWVLPPTILGAVGYAIYWLLEHAVSAMPVHASVKGDEPVDYEHF